MYRLACLLVFLATPAHAQFQPLPPGFGTFAPFSTPLTRIVTLHGVPHVIGALADASITANCDDSYADRLAAMDVSSHAVFLSGLNGLVVGGFVSTDQAQRMWAITFPRSAVQPILWTDVAVVAQHSNLARRIDWDLTVRMNLALQARQYARGSQLAWAAQVTAAVSAWFRPITRVTPSPTSACESLIGQQVDGYPFLVPDQYWALQRIATEDLLVEDRPVEVR